MVVKLSTIKAWALGFSTVPISSAISWAGSHDRIFACVGAVVLTTRVCWPP